MTGEKKRDSSQSGHGKGKTHLERLEGRRDGVVEVHEVGNVREITKAILASYDQPRVIV